MDWIGLFAYLLLDLSEFDSDGRGFSAFGCNDRVEITDLGEEEDDFFFFLCDLFALRVDDFLEMVDFFFVDFFTLFDTFFACSLLLLELHVVLRSRGFYDGFRCIRVRIQRSV